MMMMMMIMMMMPIIFFIFVSHQRSSSSNIHSRHILVCMYNVQNITVSSHPPINRAEFLNG